MDCLEVLEETMHSPRCHQKVLPLPVMITQRCSAGFASSPHVLGGLGGGSGIPVSHKSCAA